MKCKICGNQSEKIFTTLVLRKYNVDYFCCSNCDFIQTEDAYWLEEAYSSAITSLDIGLINRNLQNSSFVETTIKLLFNKDKEFVDYGGGYGMFVRMMRDIGLNYFRQDIYCENIFANNFDITDLPERREKFELLTAFEVFEHLVDPMRELDSMLLHSDNILFTTTTYSDKNDVKNWWYTIPETGQHIALYKQKTLQYIAKSKGLFFYSQNNYHLFTKTKQSKIKLKFLYNSKFRNLYNYIYKTKSLLSSDFNDISSISMSK